MRNKIGQNITSCVGKLTQGVFLYKKGTTHKRSSM